MPLAFVRLHHLVANMKLLMIFLSLFALAHAQFGFFDQMFGGQQGGGQEQAPQNNPSDANHYRSRHDQCTPSFLPLSLFDGLCGKLTKS